MQDPAAQVTVMSESLHLFGAHISKWLKIKIANAQDLISLSVSFSYSLSPKLKIKSACLIFLCATW